jgi:glycosylphosphatidylinositol transamidase
VTEHEQLGMEAWLEAYHSTSSGSNNAINFGQLDARAGSIQVNKIFLLMIQFL